MLDKNLHSPSQWRARPVVFCGNEAGAGNRLRLRRRGVPRKLACAPVGYPALGHLNGLRGPRCLPWGGPFLLSWSCSFLPPPSPGVSLLAPASGRRQRSSLLSSTRPSKNPLLLFNNHIAAAPVPRDTSQHRVAASLIVPSFGSPSQVDLDQPPFGTEIPCPLLRQLEDPNIHSSTNTTICNFDTKQRHQHPARQQAHTFLGP
jgi:hypothetical protein